MLSYPPQELWPERVYMLPGLSYPDTTNACHELLDVNLASGRGPAPAIHFGDSIISYDRLADDVMRVAAALLGLGVEPGDPVLLRLFNRPHFISTFLALLRIGAVAVPTAPLLRSRELNAIIENAGPVLLISESELQDEIEKLDTRIPCITVGALYERPGRSAKRKRDSAQPQGQTAPPVECAPTPKDTPAVILYTSGSTGLPKGCMHSHSDLLSVCDTYARCILQPTADDRFGGHPTMAFAYGLGGLLLFPLRFGASAVLVDHFTPEKFVDALRRHKVTIAFCAPISLRMMMKQVPELKTALASLRFAVSAGETLPASVYRLWRELTGVEVLDGIGSSEMLHIFISARPGRSRAGATGEVVPGYEAMVVDDATMQPVPDGTPGLLAVRGPTGCRYLRLAYPQQQYVREGWNIPGDIYIRDSDGFFQYQCRNDDLIICGGINIGGPEIEGVLLEHAAVSEVAVVSSPDDFYGMVPKAFIVLHKTYSPSDELKKDLQDFVRREIAPYKHPRKIEFLHELPKTSTGKIRRSELRRSEFRVS